MSDWSSAVCSSDLVAGAPARCDTSGRGEDRIDQCAHAATPFVCAWDAPAPRPRGVRDRPATGHRTRRHGPAPDIGCSWVLIRTCRIAPDLMRSEEHTSELQSLMRTSYAVFCLKKKKKQQHQQLKK